MSKKNQINFEFKKNLFSWTIDNFIIFRYKKELTEKDLKILKDKEKKKTHEGLDELIDSLAKKKDVSVVDKSKMDWKTFVDKKKIERELEFNRKDGYNYFLILILKKLIFLILTLLISCLTSIHYFQGFWVRKDLLMNLIKELQKIKKINLEN